MSGGDDTGLGEVVVGFAVVVQGGGANGQDVAVEASAAEVVQGLGLDLAGRGVDESAVVQGVADVQGQAAACAEFCGGLVVEVGGA